MAGQGIDRGTDMTEPSEEPVEVSGAESGAMPPATGSTLSFGDTSTTQSLVEQARNTRDDFTYGSDRAIVAVPNWNSRTSTELYHAAVDNNDPAAAEELAQSWTDAGHGLTRAAQDLYDAITELSGAWVGEASGAAQGALVGVANANSTAGDAAAAMGKRMHDQAMAAADAKAKMPPPVEFDPQQELQRILLGHPGAMALEDLQSKAAEAQGVQNAQQRIMDIYTRQLADVDAATPDFGPESLGMRPVAGGRYGLGPALAPAGSFDVGGAATDVGGRVEAVVSNTANVAAGAAESGADLVDDQLEVLPDAETVTDGKAPIALSGTAQVSTAGDGPGLAAMLGLGALGAAAGAAGARALRKSRRGAAAPAAEATESEAAAEAAAAAAAGVAPQSMPVSNVPETGAAPLPEAQPVPEKPLAPGAVTAAADPSAVAGAADAGAAPSTQPVGPSPAQQGAAPSPSGAAGMTPPMSPMTPATGAAASAGAGGAGEGAAAQAGDDEAESHSYVLEPDPHELFGIGEAITTGVIGEVPEAE